MEQNVTIVFSCLRVCKQWPVACGYGCTTWFSATCCQQYLYNFGKETIGLKVKDLLKIYPVVEGRWLGRLVCITVGDCLSVTRNLWSLRFLGRRWLTILSMVFPVQLSGVWVCSRLHYCFMSRAICFLLVSSFFVARNHDGLLPYLCHTFRILAKFVQLQESQDNHTENCFGISLVILSGLGYFMVFDFIRNVWCSLGVRGCLMSFLHSLCSFLAFLCC